MIKLILLVLMVTLTYANVGKIALVKGDANIERDVKKLKAHNDMYLLKKDIAITRQGRMQMHFNDNTVISLGKNTHFVIKEYLYLENSPQVAAIFKIEKGFIKTITGAIGKIMPELFVLETSTTKTTPHGTIWSVKVDDKSEVYEVYEGRVTLAFSDGIERKLELNSGERADLKIGQNGTVTSFKKSKIVNKRGDSKYENDVERDGALRAEERYMKDYFNDSDGVSSESVDDGNNGNGNDPDGVDESNPGNNEPEFL